MENIEITEDYEKVIKFIEKKSFRNNVLFVSGKPGVGKSVLIHYIKSLYKKEKNIVTVAPTGVAAINIKGQTIHSFFSLSTTISNPFTINVKEETAKILKKIDLLIIDEASMLRCDNMDKIDTKMKKACGNSLPFGGKKVLLVGDLFQIPPVVTNQEEPFLKHLGYDSRFFFNSHVFKDLDYKVIMLDKIFRQKNDFFKDLLNDLRVGKNVREHLAFLNNKYYGRNAEFSNIEREITIVARNRVADEINTNKYNVLTTQEYKYQADKTGAFTNKILSPELLKLKVGSQVMITQNNKDCGYYNGDICEVMHLSNSVIIVERKRDKKRFILEKGKWEQFEYSLKMDKIVQKKIGSIEQFPLMLAWAFSTHKAQGLTLKSIAIDFDKKGAFEAAQLYVALSRLVDLDGDGSDGLTLRNPLRISSVIVSQEVINYYESIQDRII